jgi:hypothetical protein
MDPLERDVEDAINVEPSPEFVARVRARVATEGTPSRWRMSPLMASAALAATIAIVVWVTRVERAPGEPATAGQVQVTASPSVPSVPAVALEAPTQSEMQAERTARRHQQRQHPAARVIVAGNELEGLRQLADLMRSGTVALTFDDAESPSLPAVQEIVVTPIAIAPLTAASTWEQGDEQ